MIKELLKKVESRNATVGVVGLGYVGLPLLIEFAKTRFRVLGIDVDERKVEMLKKGESYIRHFSSEMIASVFVTDRKDGPDRRKIPRAEATNDFGRVSECDAALICVPTPLTKNRDPDLSYIINTAEQMGPYLRSGQLIVLESTTYPGTTEEVLVPTLEKKSGLKAGSDFYVAYSPEREDPNNKDYGTAKIPKVVGGITSDSLEAARAFYDTVICETIPVSTCRTAEATKLTENIFRCINIALVNELKIVFSEMDIDIWEVIEAAATKPFGFMPFYPGPGLGGHCIPIDPFYLSWKAREHGIPTKFIELAGEINTSMPSYVVQRTLLALNEHGKSIRGCRLLLVGLAYKKNVDDDRESPTYTLWEKLLSLGAKIDYYDPFCPVVPQTREHPQLAGIKSRTWEEVEKTGYDAAVISTAHDAVDHDKFADVVKVVIDSRGACRPADNVFKA